MQFRRARWGRARGTPVPRALVSWNLCLEGATGWCFSVKHNCGTCPGIGGNEKAHATMRVGFLFWLFAFLADGGEAIVRGNLVSKPCEANRAAVLPVLPGNQRFA